jgi:hypothetical protein
MKFNSLFAPLIAIKTLQQLEDQYIHQKVQFAQQELWMDLFQDQEDYSE